MKNVIDSELIPKRSTRLSAGYDIMCPENLVIKPNEWVTIDTGLVFEDDDLFLNHYVTADLDNIEGRHVRNSSVMYEYVGLIFPRSSYGFKYGMRFANTICVIDQDYRDNILLKVMVDKELKIEKGDRIAQIIFIPWLIYSQEKIDGIKERSGGIGSTGN